MFRNLLLAFLLLCLSMPAFSQQASTARMSMAHHELGMLPMHGMLSDQEIDRALNMLQRTLNLSASQVNSTRELVRSRRDTFRSIREQAEPKFDQLMSLLKQSNSDPATVGRAMIELKTIHDQARSKQAETERQFLNLLNPRQQEIVNNLRNQAQTFAALHRIGLLGLSEFHAGMFMSALSPSSGSIPD